MGKKSIQIIAIICLLFSSIFSYLYYSNTKEEVQEINTTPNITKIAYLTFDDGPSNNTLKILDILDKYNIKATFFITGPKTAYKSSMLKTILQKGHEIAIHSYEHNYSYIYSSKENYLKDFNKCLNWIIEETGYSPTLYRFPGGSSNTIASKKLIKEIINDLKEKGFEHVDWNVDSEDSYVKNDYNKILSNVSKEIKLNESNKIYYQTILMHDDINKPSSIKALPSLIEDILQKGYTFKTLTKDSHLTKHVK